MNDRLIIASQAMAGILTGMFGERPTARPTAAKIAAYALEYADALIDLEKGIFDPVDTKS